MITFEIQEESDHRNKRPIATIQSRLGMCQDLQRRVLIDNTLIYPISDAVDCIRIKYRDTFEGDHISYIVEKADVVSVVFPPLTDVPFRKIKIDKESRKWQLTSVVDAFAEDAQDKMYSCQIPFEHDIDVGDMIFRIFIDNAQKFPIILPLTCQELLGTFGHHMIIMAKYNFTIPTDNIPQEILDCVQQMAERRLKLNF